jgi:hypothetical protein
MEDNDMIHAFPPNGPDQPFDIGILPRALGCSQDFPNAHPSCRFTKRLSVDGVAVTQQISRGIVSRECLQKLWGCPFRCRVSGNSEMNGTSAVMAENHEGKQELKRDGGHDEEVYGDQVLGVVPGKGSPRSG